MYSLLGKLCFTDVRVDSNIIWDSLGEVDHELEVPLDENSSIDDGNDKTIQRGKLKSYPKVLAMISLIKTEMSKPKRLSEQMFHELLEMNLSMHADIYNFLLKEVRYCIN